MAINWNASKEDRATIRAIAERAAELAKTAGFTYSRQSAELDLIAVHLNGCRLDLAGLLAADEGNFGHDILGIRQHLDRSTGKLAEFFDPRYSASVGGNAA